jgi:hypothetical protein
MPHKKSLRKSLRKSLKKILKKSLRKSRKPSKKSTRKSRKNCIYGVNQHGCCNKKPSVKKTKRCLSASKRRLSPCKHGEDVNGCCNKKPTQKYIDRCKRSKKIRKRRSGKVIDKNSILKKIIKSIRKSRKRNLGLLSIPFKSGLEDKSKTDLNGIDNKPKKSFVEKSKERIQSGKLLAQKTAKLAAEKAKRGLEIAKEIGGKFMDSIEKVESFVIDISNITPIILRLYVNINKKATDKDTKKKIKEIQNYIDKYQKISKTLTKDINEIKEHPEKVIEIFNKLKQFRVDTIHIISNIRELRDKFKDDKVIQPDINILISFVEKYTGIQIDKLESKK